MNAAGYVKTAEQCSNEVKKLKDEYRKIKDKHGKTGEGRSNWKFLKALENVLGEKPTTRPAIVVDSSVGDDRVSYCESDSDSASQDVAAQDPHSRSVTPVLFLT